MVPQDLIDLCRDMTAGVKPWPLYVHGPAGVGKTRFGLCLCDIVPGSVFWDFAAIAAVAFEDGSEYWRTAKAAPLIVVDELGTKTTASEYDYAALKKLADLRDRDDGRVAVYLSNLPPNRLPAYYDDRIASRLTCGTLYHFTGPDKRRAAQ